MDVKSFKIPDKVWEPKPDSGKQMRQFQKYISKKYNVHLADYWDLHAWTVSHLSEYWSEMWDYLKIISSKPYTMVYDKKASMQNVARTWFDGARLNYAENVLKYRDDHIALIALGEDRETVKYTYAALYQQTCRYAAALRNSGLQKGDIVIGYMSNREESIFAMLAATSIGALWAGIIPYCGVTAAVKNLKETPPKFLFTVDKILIEGKLIQNLQKLEEISHELHSLKKVVIVPTSPESLNLNISGIKNGCFLEEFLSFGLIHDYLLEDLKFEQVPFNHPVIMHYMRSSTGPTVLMHGCGILLNIGANLRIQVDDTRESAYLLTVPAGWAEWILFVTCLSLGSTIVVYDGDPHFVTDTYIWDLIDEYHISHFLVDSAVIMEFLEKQMFPTEKHDLSSLKVIWCTDSLVSDESYKFVSEKINKDAAFGIIYGFTEILTFCLTVEPTLPIFKGEMAPPPLGLNIICFDEAGKPVVGGEGEVVITTPYPCLPLGLYGDYAGSIYEEKYFNKYTAVFAAKDRAVINPLTRGFTHCGRSDDTITPSYVRYSPSEMYDVVNVFKEVQDSLCVAQNRNIKGCRAVLFIQMKTNHKFNQEFKQRIENAIERELSFLHIPEVILETKEIPRDFNGKKLELIVKKIINKLPYDATDVSNPGCLKKYENIEELIL